MKRNNVVKRFSIASLCLATAFSAFSGTWSFGNDVALAEGTEKSAATTVQATDLLDTTAAVTQDETGLRISSDAAYTATFKKVFLYDTTFNFRFAETATTAIYGDFNIRVADVSDENNYFDIKYYVSKSSTDRTSNYTGLYVQWGDEKRTCSAQGQTAYNALQTGKKASAYAPNFLNYGNNNARMSDLTIKWQGDNLLVTSNTAVNTNRYTIAKFDGTYDTTVSKKGFVSYKSGWGLPKLSFPNGYTITVSSNFTQEGVEDHGSDVLFESIVSDGMFYDFTSKTQFANDNYMKGYAALKEPTEKGQVFLGWKDAKNNLYSTAYIVDSHLDIGSYEKVFLGFDTVNGASVRAVGNSGIRFQTTFSANDYEKTKDYIQSFGTLLAWTDTLTKGEFMIGNYQGSSTFAQVANTKGTFAYTDGFGNDYQAYSLVVINIAEANYAKSYSARGYLVVEYADGTTQTVYTDYNTADNSRSIADVAYRLKTTNPSEYNAMSDTQKAIVDAYAAAYVA